jgi:iduronate 2-sulfatase
MAQRAIHSYYACISFMDAQVGKVMNKLKELKLDKNTIIVFIGDNGFLLGNHGWGKPTLYEGDVRIPLIVSAPGVTSPGSAARQMVELVDIYPSLAELCGLPSPSGVDGVSFVPVIKDVKNPGKEAVFSCIQNQRMVRTAKYKYTITTGEGGIEQLFDLDTDPMELKNLVNDVSMTAILDSHRAILAKQQLKEMNN